MTFAELIVKFGSEGVGRLKSDIKEISQNFNTAEKDANSFANMVKSIAAGNILGGLISGLGQNILDFGKSIVQAGIDAESANARFSAFGLDAQKTTNYLGRVAEASTLTTKQLVDMTLQLQQSGFNIYAVIPRLAKWADAIGGGTEKLQGMVRLLNLLRAGVKPDQELLQSLGFSDILVKAGLKFDQGKLVGGIRPAIEAVMNEIDRMTGSIAEKMGQTFEAKLASVTDVFDKMKETVGLQLLNMAGPWVDALKKTLSALVNSGVWKETITTFFSYGIKASNNLVKGLTSDDNTSVLVMFMSRILAVFGRLPAYIQVFADMAIKTFEYMANAISPLIEAMTASGPDQMKSLLKNFVSNLTFGAVGGNGPKTQLDLSSEKARLKLIGQNVDAQTIANYEKTMAAIKKGGGIVKPEGDALSDTANTGAGRNESGAGSKQKEHKKVQDKQLKVLEMIESHTKQTSEATLRNMTYGGGMLAAQGMSDLQLSGMRRGVGSPLINASNDINRGVEKLVRGFQVSNSLNVSFRRA
jgi:hypothetical protein